MRNYRPCRFAVLILVAALGVAGCSGRNAAQLDPTEGTAEPDRVLYERAMEDMEQDRYEVARLQLQTLMNTYPESEYLAKAKLAVADSYYEEGGVSGYTQAIAEYLDFITFFPFLDEAAYAQMQVGLAHYRQMEKPDRDRTQTIEAEAAFQTFLEAYPDSPLYPQAEQYLRDVQEILAEGEYRIANFYYLRRVNRAAASRLLDLVNRYPLYSKADQANWMLASVYERVEREDIAAGHYARIVRDYPLSPLVEDATERLLRLEVPVPQPDPEALGRMRHEQEIPREQPSLLMRPFQILSREPDVSMAAQTGTPNMTPYNEEPSDPMIRGAGSTVATSGGPTGTGAFVQTVTPGATVPPELAANPPAATASGSEAGEAASQVDANSEEAAGAPAEPIDPSEESSSQSKSGLRRIIPW